MQIQTLKLLKHFFVQKINTYFCMENIWVPIYVLISIETEKPLQPFS